MAKIGLFYGSEGGNTEGVAKDIAKELGDVDLIDIAKADKSQLSTYEYIILASPTYGSGDLQSDWEDFLPALDEIDFSGKTIALVGVGDQDTYTDTFCNGIYYIYEKVSKKGKVVGQTSTDGYEFEESKAVVNGQFVGLVLDQDNQDDLSYDRIKAWVEQIKPHFA